MADDAEEVAQQLLALNAVMAPFSAWMQGRVHEFISLGFSNEDAHHMVAVEYTGFWRLGQPAGQQSTKDKDD